MKQKIITMEQLGMLKAKLENEAKGGRSHIKITKTTTIKIDIEVYVEERIEFVAKQALLQKERHDEKMQQSVIAVYRDNEFIRVINPDVKWLYRDYDIRVVSAKQVIVDSRRKESKINRCERLCRKRDITFEEICELQNMYDHISMYETSDRMHTLRRNIEQVIKEFYK